MHHDQGGSLNFIGKNPTESALVHSEVQCIFSINDTDVCTQIHSNFTFDGGQKVCKKSTSCGSLPNLSNSSHAFAPKDKSVEY